MKLTDVFITFAAVFICVFLMVFMRGRLQITSDEQNTEYANRLTAVCHDVVKTIELKEYNKEKTHIGVWRDKKSRDLSIRVFYESLARNFNAEYTTTEEELKVYIPVLCLVDVDGYYINYNVAFDLPANVTIIDDKMDEVYASSGINTWAEFFSNGGDSFYMRYYLSDYVSVMFTSGKTYSGTRRQVCEDLAEDFGPGYVQTSPALRCLLSYDDYKKQKTGFITKKISREVEYYINTQNAKVQEYGLTYTFEIPEVAGDDWARMLSNPTAISFLQGRQTSTGDQMLNIYAFAGGELHEGYHYFTCYGDDDTLYYHCYDGPHAETVTETVKAQGSRTITKRTYQGPSDAAPHEIEEYYSTMESCALSGALPCPRCIY